MDIRKLTGDGFVDRKKIDRYAGNIESSGTSGEAKETGSASASDRLTLSSAQAAGDVAFTASVIRNLNQASLEKVRSIRQAIEKGEYDVEKALSKVTSKILSDIKSVDVMVASGNIESSKTGGKAALGSLSDETIAAISRKILRDLTNL